MVQSDMGCLIPKMVQSDIGCLIPKIVLYLGVLDFKAHQVFPQLGSVGEIIQSMACSGETINGFGWWIKTEVWHALKKRWICIHKLGRITKTLEQLHSSHKKEFHHFQRTGFLFFYFFFPWVRQTCATPLWNIKTMNRVAMKLDLCKTITYGRTYGSCWRGRRRAGLNDIVQLFKIRTLVSYEALDSRVLVIKGKTSYIWKWSIRSIQQWRRPSHCGKLGWICYHHILFILIILFLVSYVLLRVDIARVQCKSKYRVDITSCSCNN